MDRSLPAVSTTSTWAGLRRGARVGGGAASGAPAASAALVVLLLAATVAAARAMRTIRRLRRRGAAVVPLVHDLELPGVEPGRTLAVVGDSAAAGHGLASAEEALARRIGRALHARDGRRTLVRCAAVDGATTVDVLHHQLDAVEQAELVVVGVGVNDAIRGTRLDRLEPDLRTLLAAVRARAASAATVVLLTCPDLSAAPGLPTVLRPPLGRRCRAVARLQQRVADEFGVSAVPAPRAALTPEVFGDDGFHPGARGHEALATAVVATLAGPGDGLAAQASGLAGRVAVDE